MYIKQLLTSLAVIMLLSACAKELDEYNKPAIYWYAKIIDSIAEGTIEQADGYYASLQGEHIGSPLLPEATLILAMAHMRYEEYLLAEHFLDEYINRYANENEREFAAFLKIKANYLSLSHPRRDQQLVAEVIVQAEQFKRRYRDSMYSSMVDTMATNLSMADAALNEAIALLYDRLDKPKGAAYYRGLQPRKWIEWEAVKRAKTPWYRAWFEGDGHASWYGGLLPDTKSVVSRNSVVDENKTD